MTQQTSQTAQSKSSWGWGIWALYGGFVVFILTMVVYVSFINYQLVEPDYYSRGVAYQQRIESERRALALPEQPTVTALGLKRGALLQMPAGWAADISAGSVAFMRPSDHELDFTTKIHVDMNGRQHIFSEKLVPGFWRVTVSWQLNGQEYVTRHELFINSD